tara:strand:+ start:114 stop:431 length:318 start_codon:yes stop_codon:yes gene_type:complete
MENKSITTASGFEIRLNTGNLFKNNSENPKAPAYKGLVNVNGQGYDLALWKTEKGYLNVKFTEHEIVHDKDGLRESYAYDSSSTNDKNLQEAEKTTVEFDDDIPF